MTDVPKKKTGCFMRLVLFVLFLSATVLLACFWFILQPQDLSDIAGQAPEPGSRNVSVVLQNASKRNIPVTLSEKEINVWLNQRLKGSQTGVPGGRVKFERVLVRLEEDLAEVILTRKVFGRPFTVSMFVCLNQTEEQDGPKTEALLHGGPYHPEMNRPDRGGRFGRLVVPQGFLLLVLPSYKNLAVALAPEIEIAFHEMERIAIKDGRLELNPARPQDDLR
ncbi:MAG: hypothetical protein V4733_04410 [Verrucomicrobiota bacterium]